MRTPNWLCGVTATALVLGLSTGLAASGDAQEPVRLKMHSSFPGSMAVVGTAGKRLSAQIKAASDGNFQLRFFEPGALVPALSYLDAVSQGSIDSAYGAAGYNSNKDSALSFFTSVPFGMGPGAYLAWYNYGDGYKLLQEFYHPLNAHGVICGFIPPEASGWFRKEIKTLADLKGLKMRFFGIGGKVMEKFGVSTQLLAGGDIYPALELGTIDASEVGMPSLDESLGMYQVAKHYYLPGWHQPTTILDVVFNKGIYDGLSDTNKKLVELGCNDNMINMYGEGEYAQPGALRRMQGKGVTIHKWTDEQLEKFKLAWAEVVQEEGENNPNFKKVWDNYSAFRKEYAIWKEYGYLK